MFAPPPRAAPAASDGAVGSAEALQRCRKLLSQMPPMEGSVKYKRAWSIEEALEQHQCLMRQHELQSSIGNNHVQVRRMQAEFMQLESRELAAGLREALNGLGGTAAAAGGPPTSSEALQELTQQVELAARNLRLALQRKAIEERRAAEKTRRMEEEIEKSNKEMVVMREAIDDVARGGGPRIIGKTPAGSASAESTEGRQWFYCSDCRVGGHGQRFCSYLLKRPNWRVYPSEKWFEDKNAQVSYCPLGRRGVDFTDETYFSRIAMHIKGRIWLEDKRKLYDFVPDLMPLTYVISDQRWVGEPPPAEAPDAPPMPWFVKETDRNWGTSVVCCARPEECLGLSKPNSVYVVQKHIPNPLLYENGEKCHIKFYNLLIGLADGVTWHLYTYKDGYLSISPKAWSAVDLSKETQVTIIRTKRINDWPYWPKVYPTCRSAVKTVIERAASQGRLEGRNKKQFEIISADFIVTSDLNVYLLEFNTGPVLKDAEDSPDVHDAGMVSGALHIVEPWEGGTEDKWDFVLECKGHPPKEEAGTPSLDDALLA
uniref:Tubulin--tyrosine ligase-like protein 9 n=1 Tax=Alexandrium monilatum TaxID=311494 RepID=A0A7S4PX99_9DINO